MGRTSRQNHDPIPTGDPRRSDGEPHSNPETGSPGREARTRGPITGCGGSATVEQTALMLLTVAILSLATGFFLLSDERGPGRGIGTRIADRIACGPRTPDACRHHPAVEAYGWPVARALRQLAPWPMARPGPDGTPLVPVDFRYCRRQSCAVPLPGERGLRLTTSNRRITYFTEVRDRRRPGGRVELVWWLYRPGLGWESLHRTVGPEEIEAASGTRVLLSDTPMLVPLETLDGRNHILFPSAEQPPWQWQTGSIHTGRIR
jgi:hypothetical protein